MMIINLTVRDQILTACMDRLVIEGSTGHVYVSFDCDAEWDGMAKTAAFENSMGGPAVSVPVDGPMVEVPPEVLVQGDLQISLTALGDRGQIKWTTKRMAHPIRVYAAGPMTILTPEELTPALWEQILAMIGPMDELQTEDKSSLVAAINEVLASGGGGGGGGYKLPAATKDKLGGVKAEPSRPGENKGVYIDKEGFLHVAPDVLVVQATNEGGRWVASVGSETIRSFGGAAILKADVDGTPYIYQYQRYGTVGEYTGAIFDQPDIRPDAIERIEVVVDRNGNVNVERMPYTPPVQTTTAVCHDEAAPAKLAPNIWYVSKDLPRPSAAVGMMIDVQWEHGRVDGLGYDVKLIWGAPGAADNELILDQTNTSDKLTGEYSIPVQGTVRYQLVETSGRKHWQYVSGPLLPRQFSSATAAAEPDKLVPGMELSYIPGQEIFVQLDQGNTAEVARLIPDEGPTLPIYGNGVGPKTGTIPEGYILHLANAGAHWQLLNTPGSTENNDISLGITGATVGQIITVGSVDTDGKPTGYTPVTAAEWKWGAF